MDQQIISKIVLNNTREGILLLDTQGRIISFNQRAQQLLGISRLVAGENFLHKTLLCLNPKNNQVFCVSENPFSMALQPEVALVDKAIGVVHRPNFTQWLSLSSKWLIQDNENVIWISLFDISKAVTENRELLAKKRQLHLLVSSLNDIVFEVTKEGLFINFWTNNPKLLFYDPNQFLGKKIADLFPLSISIPALHLISRALISGIEQEMDFISPSDSHKDHWYHLQIKPILQSKEHLALVISDITKEVENREKIMLNENKFNQAFHFSGLGMSITALNGYCLDANRILCQMLGYSKEEIQKLSFIDCTHPDDQLRDRELRNKLLENEIESFTIEKRYRHQSGHFIWCDTTVSLVRNHKNHPQFFIVQIQNISNAKQNIEILQSQKKELESIKIDLESKIRQLQEFNEIVAHNLRTPVSNIQMLVDELLHAPQPSQKETYLTLLKDSGNNLSDTLQELADILELNHYNKLSHQNCNFNSHFEITCLKHIAKIQSKNAEITTDFAVSHIHYPAVYLESILNNLISNALTFTKTGRKPQIQVSTYLQNGKTILKVSDNGIGIDLLKFKSQLFMFKKIFHRGFDSRGIGLFITRYQVENLGGKIDVESDLGSGTSFIIQF